MSEIDKLQGQAKEILGNLTDDEKLKREGQVEQASAEAKETIEKVQKKVSDAAGNVADVIGGTLDKAGEVAADIKEKAGDVFGSAVDTAGKTAAGIKEKISDMIDKVGEIFKGKD